MNNYYNTLSREEQLRQLGMCELMQPEEFSNGANALMGKKIVIIGCGAQGLNQGLNMRDSGLDVSYALRASSIENKNQSYLNAAENGFTVNTYEVLVPNADLVINLTPDKQHSDVIKAVVPLMKKGAALSYSHGFNIVEEGMKIREDITVIMMAPKSPGSEVREEFKRGFGVPTLVAVHEENDPEGKGLELVKAYAYATGGHRAGVLYSSFVAEVKSDLMGEQTILCGVLQSASLLLFDKMVEEGVEPSYASQLVQFGWETITESLKKGGVSGMMSRLSHSAFVEADTLSETLKEMMTPLFEKHMTDILTGAFSEEMMKDWGNADEKLLGWREATSKTAFEKAESGASLPEQEYFNHGTFMVAFVKAGVELAFETMVRHGIKEESAYYESLHELPLIANTIARKKLYEMNRIISDTAEYGCYLFEHSCTPLLQNFVKQADSNLIGRQCDNKHVETDQVEQIKNRINLHPIEKVGASLRQYMNYEMLKEDVL